MVIPPFRIPFTFKISLVSDIGNMAGTTMQFLFPGHTRDLAELLALAELALLAPEEKRKSSIGWADISPSGVVPS